MIPTPDIEGFRLQITRETNHRVRNTIQWLSLLLVFQREDAAAGAQKMLNGLSTRLSALATVYAIGLDAPGSGITIMEILRTVADSAEKNHASEFVWAVQGKGPDWKISDTALIAIALLLHELVTNALKHQAEGASPEISWESHASELRISISNMVSTSFDFEHAMQSGDGVGLELLDTIARLQEGVTLEFKNSQPNSHPMVAATILLAPPVIKL